MYSHHHWAETEVEDATAQRQTQGLAALVVILLLLVGGLFLVHQLRGASVIQDCLLSGRTNCDTRVDGPR